MHNFRVQIYLYFRFFFSFSHFLANFSRAVFDVFKQLCPPKETAKPRKGKGNDKSTKARKCKKDSDDDFVHKEAEKKKKEPKKDKESRSQKNKEKEAPTAEELAAKAKPPPRVEKVKPFEPPISFGYFFLKKK